MATLSRIDAPKRLADDAYDQLLDAISRGQITAADRLVQEKLAAELGISRTPLREALLRLEQEGVLVRAGRSGFELTVVTTEEVRKIYGARLAIEGHASRLLAEHGTEADFASLAELIDSEAASTLSTASDYYNSNRRIHRLFVERADNPYLLDMFDSLWNRSVSFNLFTTTMTDEALALSVREHRELAAEIQRSTGDQASELMCRHISEGLELQLGAMAESG